MSMILLFKSLLILSLSGALYGEKKEKRDLSDLKDDPLLSSLFESDVKEKRTDRSTTLQDELLAAAKDKVKKDELNNILFPDKLQQRRETDPFQELMALNKKNSSLDAPSDDSLVGFSLPDQIAANEISKEENFDTEDNPKETQSAVNPALFQSNYLPLPGEKSQQIKQTQQGEVAKKSVIPQAAAAPKPQVRVIDYKKSMIPLPLTPEASHKIQSKSSFPVQLRVKSPNEQLRAIIPHVAEYGETVESVRQVQKAIESQGMYSTDIYKKSGIPRPPIAKKSKVKSHKKHKTSKKDKKSEIQRRQFIPQPYYASYQQMFPQQNNYLQQYPYAVQPQSLIQTAYPQAAYPTTLGGVAPQVQNMDGLHTRPLPTASECDDQYASCDEWAKNNYCVNYRAQMETQCPKACRFCTPKATQPNVVNATGTITDTDASSGSGSGDSTDDQTTKKTKVSVGKTEKRAKVASGDAESGSGADGSGADGSGGAESGSESGEGESGNVETGTAPAPVTYKMPSLNAARNKILQTKTMPKFGFGDFSFPTKKNNIPKPDTVKLNDDSDDGDSGSGSGSGSESGDESGDDSGDSETEKKSKLPQKPKLKSSRKSKVSKKTTKKNAVKRPSVAGPYPRIDLRAIASALAHYEEAALELAGEYPKPAQLDVTEYTRSFIPHPVDQVQESSNKYRQNLQVAKILTDERAKKDNLPEFLKLSKDAYKGDPTEEKNPDEADSLDSVRQRFEIPGVEPTLNDYYAETGKINPFAIKQKQSKKSKIEKKEGNMLSGDPYEYLRNMPTGASMEPIEDPKARSTIPSDHSFPVVLMKVSPNAKKYVDEPASRRGKIRKLDAEGLPVFDENKQQSLVPEPYPAPQQLIASNPAMMAAPVQPITQYFQQPQPQPQPQQPAAPLYQQEAIQPQAMNAPFMQEQAAVQPPWSNMEQAMQPQATAQFATEEQVSPGVQQGANPLRSKMLSAFFNMRNNEPTDDFSSGEGSGDGQRRDAINMFGKK